MTFVWFNTMLKFYSEVSVDFIGLEDSVSFWKFVPKNIRSRNKNICFFFSYLENDERARLAREMESFCDLEMYDIEMCSDCFDRSNTMANWFTEVCNPPHLLIWAKMNGYPYWPAKVIGVVGRRFANIRIDVRFFGGHKRTKVPPANCKLFSDNPNTHLNENEGKELAISLKVFYL